MLQFIPTKVAECGCTSPSTGVAIVNSSHLKQLLGDRCTDNTSTSGCRDQPHHNTATLSSHLQHQHIQIITAEASVTSIHRWITNQKLFQFHLSYLAGYSVGFSDLVTPVASPDRNDSQLGQDDGSTNGCCHFFGAFHPQSNMTVVVSNSNKCLKIKVTASLSTTNM